MPLIQPPVAQHFVAKAMEMDSSGNLSGTLIDRFTCHHKATITVGAETWVLSFASAPDLPCHDPIESEPLVIDLKPLVKTDTSVSGLYAGEPSCWNQASAGSFIILENPDDTWYFELTGTRGRINFGNCR